MASVASNTLPMSWCDLPSDQLGQILRRLSSCKDAVHLSAVYRHWRVCARQHSPRRRCQILLPMRVTRTARGTRVVHVRGFSTLQEQHLPLCQPSRPPKALLPEPPAAATVVVEHRRRRQQCVDGFVDSPAFAAGGLDWAIRYYPGSDGGDGERGHVGAFVRLLTKGAVARAHVCLLLLDQTTGLAGKVIWDERRRTLFDAASADRCTRGNGKLATRSDLKRSGFVRGDCLKLECEFSSVSREPRTANL